MNDDIHTSAEAAENAAIPCAHSVHADGVCPDPVELPAAAARVPLEQKSPARWAYERLVLYIQNFEKQLDTEQEAAMGFAGTHSGVLRIEGIGYFDPDIITFYGSDPGGVKTQLVQHVNQLNVILRALPKEVESEAPRRIGFRLVADLEQD
ncbi:MAG: hypothetical protein GKR99_16960 [Rhodobacteraceae bacterium]|nr:hypothetical protein [Paracoccaceae bacterium]